MTLTPDMLERIKAGWGDVPEIRLLLADLEEVERERDETFLLFAAIIHGHGGRLSVPTRSLGLIPRRPTVVREDDSDGIYFYLAAADAPETKR